MKYEIQNSEIPCCASMSSGHIKPIDFVFGNKLNRILVHNFGWNHFKICCIMNMINCNKKQDYKSLAHWQNTHRKMVMLICTLPVTMTWFTITKLKFILICWTELHEIQFIYILEHILGDQKRTSKQNIDQSNHSIDCNGVEFKRTRCGHTRSVELKCVTVWYYLVIAELLPSTT